MVALRKLSLTKVAGLEVMERELLRRASPEQRLERLRGLAAAAERGYYERRRQLLITLANSDDELSPFRKHLRPFFHKEKDELFRNARKELREAWNPKTGIRRRQEIVDAWCMAGIKSFDTRGVTISLGLGRMEADGRDFRLQFALAIAEHWTRFGICGNPDCPARYFLRGRRKQRFCELGPCTQFAQRYHALSWWRRNRQGKPKGRFRVWLGTLPQIRRQK